MPGRLGLSRSSEQGGASKHVGICSPGSGAALAIVMSVSLLRGIKMASVGPSSPQMADRWSGVVHIHNHRQPSAAPGEALEQASQLKTLPMQKGMKSS